ncbi:hypothetical protein [Vagococcus xieshaowenii]|uniref:Uncharacterized protein n=1 Tax=Vagococcus xieshaowenii TaxID=2562451 RepID=A0AAJ5EGK0_9ENTE|nr:hypothetical protein [Vagococcus xieshaowenii]QCA29710.1 hypothetical protein E4Z98_10005 [Vagococcus xieshaowenii]TFZ42925.1 hypothetical protein E4031_01440 [Vagococcus xieshaowenii]
MDEKKIESEKSVQPILTLNEKIAEYEKLKGIRSQAAIRTVDILNEHKTLYGTEHEVGTIESCDSCQEFKLFFNLHQDLGDQLDDMKKELGLLQTKEKIRRKRPSNS